MKQRISFWLCCLAVALAYGLVYGGLRQIAIGSVLIISLIPMAGLRLSALLLLPPRYWPALLLGELVPLSYQNASCIDQFGLIWVLLASVPPMLWSMPLVWLMRDSLPGRQVFFFERTKGLLICTGLISLMMALTGVLNYILELSYMSEHKLSADGPVPSLYDYGCHLFVGFYLGALAITPGVLWLVHALRKAIARRRYRWGFGSWKRYLHRAKIEGITGLLAITGLLVIIEPYISERFYQEALLTILGALIAAAWCYGWQGTAIVGTVANIAIVRMTSHYDDVATLHAQEFMCLAVTGLLLFGARTSLAQWQDRQEKKNMYLARKDAVMTEKHRVRSAFILEDVVNHANQETTRLINATRGFLPPEDYLAHFHRLNGLYQQQRRIASGLSPRAWLFFGGPKGLIAESLEFLNIRCIIQEQPATGSSLGLVSTELGQCLYRLACEAVVYLVTRAPSEAIRLQMSASLQNNEQDLVLEGSFESVGEAKTILPEGDVWLRNELAANCLNEQGMHYRAKLYGGELTLHSTAATYGRRITARLTRYGQGRAKRGLSG